MKPPRPPRRTEAGASSEPSAPQAVGPADVPRERRTSRSSVRTVPPASDLVTKVNPAIEARVLPSSQMEQRRKEKKLAGRRLWIRVGFRWAVAAALVGAVVWVLGFSSVFAVRQDALRVVTQSGATPVDETAVLERLSLEVGTPLLRVNTSEVSSDITENPQIEDVRITRLWPNGLGAELVPRPPVLAVESASGFELVAADGVVVETVSAPPKKLTRLKLPRNQSGTPTPAQIDRVLEVRRAVPKKVRKRIESMTLQGTILSMELEDGSTVIWGDDSDTQLKADVLKLLLAERKASVYDVSTPASPSTR